MKRLSVLICILILAATLFAQNNNFSYQAVIRDNNNHLVVNQNVGVRLSLIRDIPNGVGDYVETHTVQTNANGLLTLMVGTGNVVSGNMSNVDWNNHTYYLKMEIDYTGGTNYTITNVQVVAAVPFAHYAASSNYTETQVISISNDTIFLTGGTNSFVKLPEVNVHVPDSISAFVNDVGYITANDIPSDISYFNNDAGYITSYVDSQQISISGDTLKLERGGSVVLSLSCCTVIDSLAEKMDSLDNGIDSLNNIISTLESIICKPQVLTNNVAAIFTDTAVCGGYVISPCGYEVSERGVCWNTTGSANLSDSHTSDGTGAGNFTSVLTGLSLDTYYVRAYLISGNDTVYGNEVAFATMGLPVVTTTAASNVTKNAAVSGGEVTSDGGMVVMQRGVCWSMSQNPTMADNHTFDGAGLGIFTSNLTELLPATTYYVRAYAINPIDTAYGEEVSFTTVDACDGELTVTDIDGNEYNVVMIGTQCWMRENMRATTQPDGDGIGEGYYEEDCGWEEPEGYYYWEETDHEWYFYDCCETEWLDDNGYTYEWRDMVWHEEWCPTFLHSCEDIYGMIECHCNESFFIYPENNDQSLASTYGLLYNWPAAMNGASAEGAQGICPDGWHIPTQADYNTLISYVGSTSSCSNTETYTAKALASKSLWQTSNTSCAIGNDLNDNNASGFSAEPAGYEGWGTGMSVSYWISKEDKWYEPYYFNLSYNRPYVNYSKTSRDQYCSVRCIKD